MALDSYLFYHLFSVIPFDVDILKKPQTVTLYPSWLIKNKYE